MRKNILIPTDFSSNAFNAIEYAFELFKNRDCTFHIYHSYYIVASSKGNPMFPVPDEHEYKAARDLIESQMETLKKKVLALEKNNLHQILFYFEYGFLIDQIKKRVTSEKIDLVIMGTRGETNNREVAYGRNAIDVMEKVRDCPVIAIPANIRYRHSGEIVFPTDFKSNVSPAEVEVFKTIAITSSSSIRIFHVGREDNLTERQLEGKQQLEKYLQPLEYSFHYLQNVSIMEGLLLFVKQRKSTMICFVNRKHWFFGNIFSNPLIKNLGVHSTVPIIALHGS